VTPVRPARAIRDGFVIGVTNPKTIVFFVVALPEFTVRGAGHLPVSAQTLIIGALFPVIARPGDDRTRHQPRRDRPQRLKHWAERGVVPLHDRVFPAVGG
jgi:hypothetical protein